MLLPFARLLIARIHVTAKFPPQDISRFHPWPSHLPFSASRRYRQIMPQLDPKVAAVVDAAKGDDSDEDALIAELEDDSELDAFREQRLQQLHAEFDKARQLRASDHGTYSEIKDEKALMDITTSTKLCIVHFFKPDFNRCRIMDTHLEVSSRISYPSNLPHAIIARTRSMCLAVPSHTTQTSDLRSLSPQLTMRPGC